MKVTVKEVCERRLTHTPGFVVITPRTGYFEHLVVSISTIAGREDTYGYRVVWEAGEQRMIADDVLNVYIDPEELIKERDALKKEVEDLKAQIHAHNDVILERVVSAFKAADNTGDANYESWLRRGGA